MAIAEVIYLHGFASGPSSQKATYFADKMRAEGFTVHVPDLNEGDFEKLTLTRQLALIDSVVNQLEGDVLVFGSSMGGLLATLTSQRHDSVKGLVLLAPGFGLSKRWKHLLGDEKLVQWQRQGKIPVFHHGAGANVDLSYSFIADAESYQTEDLLLKVPALVFHGRNDDVVPVDESIKLKEQNDRSVSLHLLDSDHGLLDVLPFMWQESQTWLERHHFIPAETIA